MDFEPFIKDLIRESLKRIEISFVAKIVSFDKAKMRATITPQLQITNTDGSGKVLPPSFYPNFNNIPVQLIYANGFFIRPDYAVNDLVNCVVPASSTKLAVDDKIKPNQNQKGFDLTNCYITGAVLPTDFSFPTEFASKSGLL